MADAVAPLLIDTDILIDYLRGQAAAVSYLESLAEPLLISAITVAELYAGVGEGTERQALESFVTAFHVVMIDEMIAERGGLHRRTTARARVTTSAWPTPSLRPPPMCVQRHL